jgi:methyltransferase (TIGR00027 family)
MQAGRPSATAEAIAAARAFGAHIYDREQILVDPYAERFLGGRFARLYQLVRRSSIPPLNLGLAALYDQILPGALGWVLTRHRYFDDAIDAVVRDGAKQVVFVGAGYDSRAFRQPALAKLDIFEIDHPDTQARKKQIVEQIFGQLPSNVAYLPLDATKGDLRQLPKHGFDRHARTLFVIEGFLWYMPPEIARAILAAIVSIAAPQSQIIFDYTLPSVVDGTCLLEGAERHRAYCARRGEPILFGIDPRALPGYLLALGLGLIDDVGSEDLQARYTATSRRTIKVYPFLRIARAMVRAGVSS